MVGPAARTAGVLYQDGAVAASVPGGTLWLFGDTFLGAIGADGKPSISGAVSNTLAIVRDDVPRSEWPPRIEYFVDDKGVAAAPLALLPTEDEKARRLWPLAAVWTGEYAYMFYALIEVTGEGPWGFRGVGTGIARSSTPFGRYERLPVTGIPIDPNSIVRSDGYLYMYAPRRFKGEKDLSSGLLIARVKESAIEEPGAYEFFGGLNSGGASWVRRIEHAVPATGDVWGQASVAWNEHLGAYLLTTSSNFFRHDEIQLRAAATLWGPWSPVGPGEGRFKVPERTGEETQLIYCSMLHPELDQDGGRVMTLTFCRMLKRPWALTNPEGLRIELAE